MVIGYRFKLVVAGLAIGVALAVGLSRFLETLLVNTGALDSIAYVSAALVLVAVAALGCYVPARRAVRVDPMATLRYE
jgi:ABC-type antimicrobial peptide transport system permease subunit